MFTTRGPKPHLYFRNGRWIVIYHSGDPFVVAALRWALNH